MFVCDTGNNRIRAIDTAMERVKTIAGDGGFADRQGRGVQAGVCGPQYITADPDSNTLFVSTSSNRILQIKLKGHEVTILAGSGKSTAVLSPPPLCAWGRAPSPLPWRPADLDRTRAGKGGFADGAGESAMFLHPKGVAFDQSVGLLGTVYVVDASNSRLRAVDVATRNVRTVAGFGEVGSVSVTAPPGRSREGPRAKFNAPGGCHLDARGNVIVADRFNGVLRRIDPKTGVASEISIAVGTGASDQPVDVAQGGTIFRAVAS